MSTSVDNDTFKRAITNLVRKLNSFNLEEQPSDLFRFIVKNKHVGLMYSKMVDALAAYPDVFSIGDKKVEILDKYQTSEEITEIVEKVLIDLRGKKIFSELDGWRNEHYSVKERFSDDKPVFTIERSAASLFSIKCYGCHINGYFKRDNQYFLWIARRSRNKETYPGMLDNFTAGGLTAGLSTYECALKELQEEAGVGPEIARKLKMVDAISYAELKSNRHGIKREGEFIFDIKLPVEFIPKNTDGEVEQFYLMNVEQVKHAIIQDDFKPNSAVVTLNFLMRKGLLTPDQLSNYLEILENIHAPGL